MIGHFSVVFLNPEKKSEMIELNIILFFRYNFEFIVYCFFILAKKWPFFAVSYWALETAVSTLNSLVFWDSCILKTVHLPLQYLNSFR